MTLASKGWAMLRRRSEPTAFPFGAMLQHRNGLGPIDELDMNTLKAMVVGRADYQHPERIKVIRLRGGVQVGQCDDVYVDSWEPIDGQG